MKRLAPGSRTTKLNIEELEPRIAPTVLTVGSVGAEEEGLLPAATGPLGGPLQDASSDPLLLGLTDSGLAQVFTDISELEAAVFLSEAAGGPTASQLDLILTGGEEGSGGQEPSGGASNLITGVTPYIWHHGCGPTAVGMVIGYWDTHGYGNLVLGDASDTSGNLANIQAMMASSEHYNDYSLPIDDSGTGILLDASSLGGAHTDNCVADFMQTSWSSWMQWYGWSRFSRVDNGFEGWAGLQGYSDADAWNEVYGADSWGNFVAEIDAGYPVVFLVDTNGDGGTDHYITAVGYDDSTMQYAAYNTWNSSLHWYDFALVSEHQAWSIYGATYFRPGTSITSVSIELGAASDTGVSSSDGITSHNTPTFNVTVPGSGTIYMDYGNDGSYDDSLTVSEGRTYSFQNGPA
ncbi:MAG: hypothetical protein KAX80_13705, partial [Planctomycetes bacterium]|nr:hypothetical protein [Planctomycetota bacterium]